MNLARVVHEIWAHWMTYMFTQGRMTANGEWIMPEDKVKRWTRQANTKFDDLSVTEQTSDYSQADKILAVIKTDQERMEFEVAAEVMIETLERGYRPALYLTDLSEDEIEERDYDDSDYTIYRAAWFDGKGLISLDGKLVQEHDDMTKLINAMNTIKPLGEWD